MIKVSVLYPAGNGHTFDMSYYLDTHMPMVRAELGAALRGVAVDQGVSGGAPGAAPAFLAIGHLLFDSEESFRHAFDAHAQAILSDIPNYTNTQPTVQVSEVRL